MSPLLKRPSLDATVLLVQAPTRQNSPTSLFREDYERVVGTQLQRALDEAVTDPSQAGAQR